MLDPELRALFDSRRSSPVRSTPTLAEVRRRYDSIRSRGFGPVLDVDSTEDLSIPVPSGDLPARLYRPAVSARCGLLVHVHGGGFGAGSLAGYDKDSRALAVLGSCSVLTFEYRLAPEHPFPAAVEDSTAALLWALDHASDLGCDPTRVAVFGDSAGGNLATVAALHARDQGRQLAFQLLIYPNTDYSGSYRSMEEFGDLVILSRDDVEWARDQYLRGPEDRLDWRCSPLLCPSLRGVARALIFTAECDVLRDEGEAYAHRLQSEGVKTTLVREPGMAHGFFAMGAVAGTARRAVERICAALRDAWE